MYFKEIILDEVMKLKLNKVFEDSKAHLQKVFPSYGREIHYDQKSRKPHQKISWWFSFGIIGLINTQFHC